MPPLAPFDHLTSAQAGEIRGLADRAEVTDGVAPLSERFLLGLADDTAAGDGTGGGDGGGPHVVMRDDRGRVTAYGRRLEDGSAELVVDPAARRQGHGGAVLAALRAYGEVRVWAHGDLEAAQAFAGDRGLTRVRALHKLARPLTGADARAAPVFPPGFTLRGFEPGDEKAWLAVNAAAFADHPEQGQVTRADFDRLTAQPWFDPAGLLLLESEQALLPHGDKALLVGSDKVLAGSHWTKVDPDERAPDEAGDIVPAGEVYVLALAPAFHGYGLAAPLTQAGLRHLAERGLRAVVLYVDEDNERAMRTYRGLGFTTLRTDSMYAAPSAT